VGIVIEFLKSDEFVHSPQFDYAKTDSIFNSVQEKINADSAKFQNKKFDYKQEVLDFSTDKANEKSKKLKSGNKKFDLNSIGFSELIGLPGIGKKVAENIIEYRNKNGKFNSIEQLLEIKGIGEKKLDELKEFLIIK
jgi:competence protein ComEA